MNGSVDLLGERPLGGTMFRAALLFFALCLSLTAQPATAAPKERPTVGLVLSGGGALGATHVGVIKVLEELQVPVDIVVGTSMGSIVGGLYAMGLSASELDSLVRSIDWAGAFEDRPPRSDRSFRRKQDDYGFLIDMKVGIKDGSVQFPPGVIQGQRLTMLLRALSLRARAVDDFDDLPIRYRAVAADLETGREVVIGRGNIATAMRASMSVPGVFPPVDVDGKLLVDGGVANNLPVDVARKMGADVVIVVDIPTVLKKRDQIKSTLDVAGQMLAVLIQQNSLPQIASVGPRDVLIQPDLGKMGSADFGRIADAIDPGEKAARGQTAKLKQLAKLKDAPRAQLSSYYRDPVPGGEARRAVPSRAGTYGPVTAAAYDAAGPGGKRAPNLRAEIGPPPVISFVEVNNKTKLSSERIRRLIHQKIGEPLDAAQLDKDFAQIYGLGDFEQVDYALVERDGKIGMVVTATEKAWAKDYFRVGLALEHDFSGRSSFTLGGAVTFTGLDQNGAEWRSELSIGAEQRLFTEYYQPLQPTPGWYVLPQAEYYQRNFYAYGSNGINSEYRLITAEARFMVGVELGSEAMLAAGVRFGRGDLQRLLGTAQPSDVTFNIGGARLLAISDTLDDADFPSEGRLVRATLDFSMDALGADRDYTKLDVTANQAFEIGRTRFIVGGRGGTALAGTLPIYDRFSGGGLFSVSGYARNEVSGANMLSGRMVVMHPLTESTPLAFNLPLYIGGSLEALATDDGTGEGLGRRHYGGSVFTAAATPLGPLYLGLGVGDGGRRAGYLYMGRLF
jgi:NTE family protein